MQQTDANDQTYATMVNEETIDSINLDDHHTGERERDEIAQQFSFYGKSDEKQDKK